MYLLAFKPGDSSNNSGHVSLVVFLVMSVTSVGLLYLSLWFFTNITMRVAYHTAPLLYLIAYYIHACYVFAL